MKLKHIVIVFFFIGFANIASAQYSFSVEYNYSTLGSKDLNEFIKKDSWRGMDFEFQYMLKPQVSIGLLTGYQHFYEKRPRATYTNGSSAFNAVTWRYFKDVPLLITSKYYFKGSGLKPYLGAGIGLSFSKQEIQIGDYLASENSTNFGLMAEGGLQYDFNQNFGLMFNTKYHYRPYNSDEFSTNNIGYLTVGLGLVFEF